MSSPVNPEKKSGKKYEDYELDNHVRTMQDAGKIMGDGPLKKAVLKHAKKKKMELHKAAKMMSHGQEEASESPEEDAMESASDEKKEIKSIDQIRSRRKKLKARMSGV